MNMDAILAAQKAKRADCIAQDGSVQRKPEKKEFWNALLDWHKAGKPEAQEAELRAWEKKLRKEGKF